MGIRKFTSGLVAAALSLGSVSAKDASDPVEKLWHATYEKRQKYFKETVGPLPNDILKMLNMMGVWPGGGLYVIPAPKIGKNLSVYTTFGLTNPDMPTKVKVSGFKLESDGQRATQASGELSKKLPAPKQPGAAGYGYEIIMVAQSGWPLNFLQWAVGAEIVDDAGLLARVEKYDGLTVEQIEVGQGQSVNVLIAKASAPLPVGTTLPDGRMKVLVAITITDQEMSWSQTNGRGQLLKKLQASGQGQVSVLSRQSIVQ